MQCYRCNAWPCSCSDGQTIIHGDCREVLPELPAVDCVVTSPPYNTLGPRKLSGMHATSAGASNFFNKTAAGYDGKSDEMCEQKYQQWLNGIVCDLVAKCDGLVWVNHKTRYRDGEGIHPLRFLSPPLYAEVVWQRDGAVAFNCKRYAPCHEYFFGFGKPSAWNDHLNTLLTVWREPSVKGSSHPCPFPPKLVSRLLESSTQPGQLVLDPFAGSGTTLRVAKDLGRRSVGVDQSERFCEMAARRLEQGVLAFGDSD